LKHFAAPDFWYHYRALSADIQANADRAFARMNADPHHPSIHLKRVGDYWSARIGLQYRALGVGVKEGVSGSGRQSRRIRQAYRIATSSLH
jgi:hypothetical protein